MTLNCPFEGWKYKTFMLLNCWTIRTHNENNNERQIDQIIEHKISSVVAENEINWEKSHKFHFDFIVKII